MMTLTKLVIVSNSFSVLSGILELWLGGHYLLFVILFVFSVLVPILKLLLLFKLNTSTTASPTQEKLLSLMHDFGRWAMLDVLVAAILIVAVKLGAVASVEIHSGLYFFAASVFLIMLINRSTKRISLRQFPHVFRWHSQNTFLYPDTHFNASIKCDGRLNSIIKRGKTPILHIITRDLMRRGMTFASLRLKSYLVRPIALY